MVGSNGCRAVASAIVAGAAREREVCLEGGVSHGYGKLVGVSCGKENRDMKWKRVKQ